MRHVELIEAGESIDESVEAVSKLLTRLGGPNVPKLQEDLDDGYAEEQGRTRAADGTGPRKDQTPDDADGSPQGAPGSGGGEDVVDGTGTIPLADKASDVLNQLGDLEVDKRRLERLRKSLEAVKATNILTPENGASIREGLATGNDHAQNLAEMFSPGLEPVRSEAVHDASEAETSGMEKIPLSALSVSNWNPRKHVDPDDQDLERFAADIKKRGLIQPVVLVRRGHGEDLFDVLCGCRRIGALRINRGPEGVLEPGEYRVHEDLAGDGIRCLEMSAAENWMRSQPPPYAVACFFEALITEKKCKASDLAKAYFTTEAKVSYFRKLVTHFRDLPESWQSSLRGVKGAGGEKPRPAITLSHWGIVAATVKAKGVTPELREIMEQAVAESWTIEQLREQMKTNAPSGKKAKIAKIGNGNPPEIKKTEDPPPGPGESPETIDGDEAERGPDPAPSARQVQSKETGRDLVLKGLDSMLKHVVQGGAIWDILQDAKQQIIACGEPGTEPED
jgi:hypothetical protein